MTIAGIVPQDLGFMTGKMNFSLNKFRGASPRWLGAGELILSGKAEQPELFQPGEEGTTYRKAFQSQSPLKGKKKKIIFKKRFHSVRYHFLLYFCFWRMLLRVGKGIYYLPGLFPQELLIKS